MRLNANLRSPLLLLILAGCVESKAERTQAPHSVATTELSANAAVSASGNAVAPAQSAALSPSAAAISASAAVPDDPHLARQEALRESVEAALDERDGKLDEDWSRQPTGTPPQIRTGKLSVSGRLSPEEIKRVVRRRFGFFRLCYKNGLMYDPLSAGEVTVTFTIKSDGKVQEVTSRSTLSDKAPDRGVGHCIGTDFQRMTFPKPDAGVVKVTYPVLLTPPAR